MPDLKSKSHQVFQQGRAHTPKCGHAVGSLVISTANPRYFTFAAGEGANRKAVYLTGINMSPRGVLSSTGYALANPWKEYLILQPGEQGGPFTVSLEPGIYWVEWYNVTTRETMEIKELDVVCDGNMRFVTPFADPNPSVLYLIKKGN